ncbi:MAG: AmmeMemoRadiSam system protein A [Gammaproteobacteria bacterium]|nr:AmmeMemoRadiSam system protein A [Gammaproteobacteria bacterium]
MLTKSQQQLLLAIAHNAIASELNQPLTKENPLASASEMATLQQPAATFVTLTLTEQLRGCIGCLTPHRPLAEDVRANAAAAAFHDPRFPPLTVAEFAALKINISLLSPDTPLTFRNEADLLQQLRPHIDGLIVAAGSARATFLPSVWQQLPQPQQFWQQLKRKAGIAATLPVSQLQVSRYTTFSFSQPQEG